jgi:hypothetical protein
MGVDESYGGAEDPPLAALRDVWAEVVNDREASIIVRLNSLRKRLEEKVILISHE